MNAYGWRSFKLENELWPQINEQILSKNEFVVEGIWTFLGRNGGVEMMPTEKNELVRNENGIEEQLRD